MILVDTSIWIDHLRKPDLILSDLLAEGRVLMHPFIIGELSLGHIRRRDDVLRALRDLPPAVVARDDEVAALIEGEKLYGRGIGYIDAHLVASVRLTQEAAIWTGDRTLLRVAQDLRLAAVPGH